MTLSFVAALPGLMSNAMEIDIDGNVAAYLGQRGGCDRYASYDYCFNYFRSHFESGHVATLAEGPTLQTSCLQLGFYLASWGMFRGKAQLLTRSSKALEPAVAAVVEAPALVWTADADSYNEETIDALLAVRDRLRRSLPGGRSDTLTSKVMLGVFGCVPAFDRYFRKGLGVTSFGRKSLRTIATFYEDNAEAIDRHLEPTLDFETGKASPHRYTRAKVIDMVFFTQGFK